WIGKPTERSIQLLPFYAASMINLGLRRRLVRGDDHDRRRSQSERETGIEPATKVAIWLRIGSYWSKRKPYLSDESDVLSEREQIKAYSLSVSQSLQRPSCMSEM